MSLAQLGNDTVALLLNGITITVRELEIPRNVDTNFKIDNYQFVHSWKNHCQSKKLLEYKQSKIYEKANQMAVTIDGHVFDIHYKIRPIRFGIYSDKRLSALAVILLV